jgi:hypothetical protein
MAFERGRLLMRRTSLLTVSAIGLLVCLLGGSGLFAALVDMADTGPNTITTAPLPGSADLQLAPIIPDPSDPAQNVCGTFSDNLATGLFSVASGTPPFSASNSICVRNVGSQAVSISVGAFDLTDVDTACTGDEAAAGDLSCGGSADGSGELSEVVNVIFFNADCTGSPTAGDYGLNTLDTLVGTVIPLSASLASNGTVCYYVEAGLGAGATSTQLQVAQSDSTAWRFRFEGVALP